MSNIIKTMVGVLINSFMGLPQASSVLAYAQFKDDCDHDHPAKLHVWLDTEADLKALDLSVWTENFRATSKSAASGGGSTSGAGGGQTSSSTNIDHTHSVTAPDHKHEMSTLNLKNYDTSTVSGHSHDTTWNDVLPLYDVSDVLTSSSQNTSGGGGGSHSHSTSDHVHTTPNHVHNLIFGLYEFGFAAAVKAYINDPTFSTPINAFGTRGSPTSGGTFELINLSLLQYYDIGGSGVGKLGAGANAIYLVPQTDPTNNPEGLLRIEANVRPKYKS